MSSHTRGLFGPDLYYDDHVADAFPSCGVLSMCFREQRRVRFELAHCDLVVEVIVGMRFDLEGLADAIYPHKARSGGSQAAGLKLAFEYRKR